MSTPFHILDGYNLLHAAGLARLKYGPGDLGRQRTKLLAKIAEKLRPEERSRCTVVFDAHEPPPDANPRQKHLEIAVLFAPDDGDADVMIEELVRTHPSPRQLIVVSSDHRLQKAVARRGGKGIDSEDWLQQQERRPRTVPRLPTTPPPALPARDQQSRDWQQEFGEFSVAELAAEVAAESPDALPKEEWDRYVDRLEADLKDPAALERWLNDPRGGRSPGADNARKS